MIYNSIDEPLRYAILEGDYSDLNGACINSYYSPEKEKKACDLLFDPETGSELIHLANDVSLIEGKDWNKVAVITFLP